jgi:hypothetical protein
LDKLDNVSHFAALKLQVQQAAAEAANAAAAAWQG